MRQTDEKRKDRAVAMGDVCQIDASYRRWSCKLYPFRRYGFRSTAEEIP